MAHGMDDQITDEMHMRWCVVITPPDGPVQVYGPFVDVAEARMFEDRRIDAPEGSTGSFVPLWGPRKWVPND